VAWRLLWLTYLARQTPDVACTVALQPQEWQVLYVMTQRSHRLPTTPPSLRQAVRWIGQLGGFLGRQSPLARVGSPSGLCSGLVYFSSPHQRCG